MSGCGAMYGLMQAYISSGGKGHVEQTKKIKRRKTRSGTSNLRSAEAQFIRIANSGHV
jgi:hypothetical protein